MRYSKPYHDAVALQRVIMKDSEECSGKDLAALAGSFVKLEMLKLRLRMKPAPKPIDVSKAKQKNHAEASFE